MYSYFINREIKIDSGRGGETIDLLFMVLLFFMHKSIFDLYFTTTFEKYNVLYCSEFGGQLSYFHELNRNTPDKLPSPLLSFFFSFFSGLACPYAFLPSSFFFSSLFSLDWHAC